MRGTWRRQASVLRMLWRFQRPHVGWAGLAAVLLVATSALELPAPLVTRYLVDTVIPSGDTGRLDLLALLLVAAVLAFQGAGYVYRRVTLENRLRVEADLRQAAWEAVARAAPGGLGEGRTGYLEARLDADVDMVGDLFLGTVLQVALEVATLLVGAGLLVHLNPRLAAVAIVALPLFVLTSRAFVRSLRELSAARQEAWARFRATLVEVLAGLFPLKTLAAEERAGARYEERLGEALGADRAYGLRSLLAGLASGLVGAAVPLFVLWYGARGIMAGRFTLGGFLAFHGALGYLFGPARSLLGISFNLAAATAAGERVAEVLALPAEDAGRGGRVPREVGRVEARALVVDPGDGPRVGPVDLSLSRGEWLGIIGPTGCGKTTLLRTLGGFLPPAAGEVLVDGRPLREYRPGELRRRVVYVPQEPWLLAGTLRENLLLGRGEASGEEIAEALRLAVLEEVVAGIPGGLDASVREAGASLSGGERQRLCLARAFLLRPDVLLLDEVTAGLDPGTETELFARLRRWSRRPAIAWVTHRREALRWMDRVLDLGTAGRAAAGAGS